MVETAVTLLLHEKVREPCIAVGGLSKFIHIERCSMSEEHLDNLRRQ
jgi:hypothetical protein